MPTMLGTFSLRLVHNPMPCCSNSSLVDFCLLDNVNADAGIAAIRADDSLPAYDRVLASGDFSHK